MNMQQPPPARMEIPNYGNYQPDQELLRLRRRIGDLMRLGVATPDTYFQTVMQLFQEAERRRQTCMNEAEDHLRKHHALVAQAHGFSAVSSILYSIINGFASLEERRLQEMADRAKEKAENGPVETKEAPPPPPVTETPKAPPAPAETKVEVKTNHKSGGKRKKS